MKHLLLCAENHMGINSPIFFSTTCIHTQLGEEERFTEVESLIYLTERFVEVDSLKYFTQACINLYQAKNNFNPIHWMIHKNYNTVGTS